jgi:hypothetical protein
MDLIMKMDISLTEALCGMKKTVQTLDDRTLVMQTVPGLLFFTRFNITDIDFLRSSVADPQNFVADPDRDPACQFVPYPDPAFHFDADLDPDF